MANMKACLESVLQNETCHLEFPEEDLEDLENVFASILHSLKTSMISVILAIVSISNSLVNPVLYALWYPEFRKYVSDMFQYLIEYVKNKLRLKLCQAQD